MGSGFASGTLTDCGLGALIGSTSATAVTGSAIVVTSDTNCISIGGVISSGLIVITGVLTITNAIAVSKCNATTQPITVDVNLTDGILKLIEPITA